MAHPRNSRRYQDFDMDNTAQLADAVNAAIAVGKTIVPKGGGSKSHYRVELAESVTIDTSNHEGIVHYHPDELVVRVRAGTKISTLNAVLAESGQYLPAEPPDYDGLATIGGAIASGLSGSGRPYWGGLKDYVLGIKLILPSGEVANFGGDVMKNVAGYDLSRLQVGAMGSLGLILDIALKILPKPLLIKYFKVHCQRESAVSMLANFGQMPGLTGLKYFDSQILVRLSGSAEAVAQAEHLLPVERAPANITDFQKGAIDQLQPSQQLWRWDGQPAAPLEQPGLVAMDWGGALRWLDADSSQLKSVDSSQMTFVKTGSLPRPHLQTRQDGVGRLQNRIKAALDPEGHFIDYPALRLYS